MTEGSTKSGPPAYGSGFLSARHQGTALRNGPSPILYLSNHGGNEPKAQRDTLDFVKAMNRLHQQQRPGDARLEARIASYELAFRMQSAATEAVDLNRESRATKAVYGIGDPLTDGFGRKCLLARRLVERGVRFVQIYSGAMGGHDWDMPT